MGHRIPRHLPSVLLSATVLIAPTAAAAQARLKPSRAVAVPIAIVGGQGSATGARPTVDVRIGNSKPVPVLLDTGSTGLQIYASAVNTTPGGRVTVTSRRDSITYAGGTRFTGLQARAVIRIGRQATAVSVPFGLVRQASCVPSKPDCGASGVSHPMSDGAYGVLGIGMTKNPEGLFSPILAMPGALGLTWSLHLTGNKGLLVMGAPIPSGPGAAVTVQLRRRGTSGGHAAWTDARVRLCDTVGAIRACVPGLFDSGTSQMQLRGSPLNTAPTERGKNRVAAGTRVSVSLPGVSAPFWAFNAGVTKSRDTVTVKRAIGRPFVNYGVQAFYAFTIAYDETNGRLTLGARNRAARSE